ncbi:MAG: stage II sporulation protein P, partial [Oscillibacter sp.]|nr:stage II sporulation protein P [Oscillibacter sp.]
YDYPSYSGAYDRSLASIQRYLEEYPTIQYILDVHRDAIEDGQGNQYKVVSELNDGRTAAQMSLVIGSDGSGLSHPNWLQNLRLAATLQNAVLEEHPSLMRPITLRNSRYNQHATTGSLLLEVGAAGNAPQEAILAGRLFAGKMAEILTAPQT